MAEAHTSPSLVRKRYPRNQYKLLKQFESRVQQIYLDAWREHQPHSIIVEKMFNTYKEAGPLLSSVSYRELCSYSHGLADFFSHQMQWKVFHNGEHKFGKDVPKNGWLEVESDKGQFFYPNSSDVY